MWSTRSSSARYSLIYRKTLYLKTVMKNCKIGWNFDNTYAKLPNYFFTKISPEKVPSPKLMILNHDLGKELGLHLNLLNHHELAELFSGNTLPHGAESISLAYAGHQFGYFNFLGDGRAHLIGEHKKPNGERVDIQLKGSGKTPYGNRGDGKAVLGPMLREYIISEANHALGIPTTRSLAVVLTGEQIQRDTLMPGAVLTRIASSHIRIGSFEYLASQQNLNGLKILADYVITRHYPEALETENPYLYLLKRVIEKQVDLIVHWMRVGFIHGVMNTDNMSISGETIDYGPCAFMDWYDPATVFSSIDQRGRYAYGNQPIIAQWNLARFAEAILPILHEDRNKAIQLAEESVQDFATLYEDKWLDMMSAKLGLVGKQGNDKALILNLLNRMQAAKADFTNTFYLLSKTCELTRDPISEQTQHSQLLTSKDFQDWYASWQERLKQNNFDTTSTFTSLPPSSLSLMRANNPCVIPRNHKVNQALDEAVINNYEPFFELLRVLTKPYEYRDIENYQLPPTASEQVHNTFCGT